MPDVLHFKRDMAAIDFDQMIGPDFGHRYLGIKAVDYDAAGGAPRQPYASVEPAGLGEPVHGAVDDDRAGFADGRHLFRLPWCGAAVGCPRKVVASCAAGSRLVAGFGGLSHSYQG
jgi:hypothetical protein